MSGLEKKAVGWLLIMVGLLIILTPFTPGSILFFIGVDLVFGDWPEWKRLKNKAKEFFWKT